MPTHLAESPLTCVAVGSGRSLEEFEAMRNSQQRPRPRRPRATGAVVKRLQRGAVTTAPARLEPLVPRNRTVRVAVLGSSVQRAAASGYSSTRSSAAPAPDRRRLPRRRLARADHGLVPLERARRREGSARRCCVRSRSRRTASRGRSATRRLDARRSSTRSPRTRKLAARERARCRAGSAADERATQQNGSCASSSHYAGSPSFPQDYNAVGAQRARRTRRRSTRRSRSRPARSDGIALEDVVVTTTASSAR